MRRVAHAALALAGAAVLAGCGGAGDGGAGDGGSGDGGSTGSAGRTTTIDGDQALTWGEGPYGVVLAHGAAFDAASWEEQATAIAAQGATVLAVEDISPAAIRDAVEHLQDGGIDDVALVGASAGADAVLALAAQEPGLPDQLVLLSPNRAVDGLGTQPKLFIAGEDEPVAGVSTELADSAPGSRNEVLLLPGSAHAQHVFDTDQADAALDAVLGRLARPADG